MEQAHDHSGLTRAIIVTQFAPPFMISGVAVILPAMGGDLGAGATSLGLVETLFLASHLSFLLAAGRLADASDKRTLYKLGLACFASSSLLIGLLSSVPGILFLRFVQGASGAVFAATGPAILSEIVPPERRGWVYGRSIGAIYSGLTLGPVVAGFLADLWGWRCVFLTGAVLTASGCVMISVMMPSLWRRPEKKSVHIPSALLIVVAGLCLVAGSATLRQGPFGYTLLAAAAATIAGFIRLQFHLERPLVDVRALMTNHILRMALLIQMLLYVNAFSAIFLTSLYMQVSLGRSASLAGQIIAVSSLLMAALAPIAGRLSDRYRPQRVQIFGVGFLLISAAMGTQLHNGSSLTFITLMLAVQGMGFAFFSTPNMTIIMGSVPPTAVGMASALGAKARALGMMSGMLVATLLISLDFGNNPITEHPERLVRTIVTTFTILSVITATAFVLVVWRQSGRKDRA
jgi:MFS family permease